MGVSRLRALNAPSSGLVPQFPGGSRYIKAGFPKPTAGYRRSQFVDRRNNGPIPHAGVEVGRGVMVMTAPDFHSRRDRGWRRGFPFRHSDWMPEVLGSGYRGVGNIHVQNGMRPPRILVGLLPRQTSTWKPYRYPLNGQPPTS